MRVAGLTRSGRVRCTWLSEGGAPREAAYPPEGLRPYKFRRSERKCWEKTRKGNVFDSEEVAALDARGDRLRSGLNIYPYRCSTCGKWHTGNNDKVLAWRRKVN